MLRLALRPQVWLWAARRVMSCDAYQYAGFGLSKAALCFLEFAGISGGMNSISSDVTVRHLDTLES